MSDCLFCKIAAGEIPASVVSKNDAFLAFRDINPQAPTHVLAMPVQHVASLNDVKDGHMLGELMAFARDVAREAGLSNTGYRVVANTNHDGGQTVNHLHLHILGGREMKWPPG
jgi:histidine triad (HIT) family protein